MEPPSVVSVLSFCAWGCEIPVLNFFFPFFFSPFFFFFPTGLAGPALEIAVADLMKVGDTKNYKLVMEKLGKPVDGKWVQESDKEAVATKEKLDSDLNVAKNNMVKEDIRVASMALGHFYYNRNDLNSALKCYIRTRDYCSSSQHMIEMCLAVIKTAIGCNNWSHVQNYLSKAEQTPDISGQAATLAKLRIANGLSHLQSRKYKQAARVFLDAAVDMGGNTYSEVLSNTDCYLYAGVCALATYDRADIRRQLINNPRVKACLDQVPDVQALVQLLYNCKYTEGLQLLEKSVAPRMAVDINLAEHCTFLCTSIRNKAIVQFFTPYSAVDLKFMAAAFNTTVPLLEVELKNLIVEDAIQARIDSFNQVLVAKETDQRTQMFRKANETGKEFQTNMRDMLLRMDLVMNDFSVKPVRRQQGDGKHPSKFNK